MPTRTTTWCCVLTLSVLLSCDLPTDLFDSRRHANTILPLAEGTRWIYQGEGTCESPLWVDTVWVSGCTVIDGDSVWSVSHSRGWTESFVQKDSALYRVAVDSGRIVVRRLLAWIPLYSGEVRDGIQSWWNADTIQTPIGTVTETVSFESVEVVPPQDSPYGTTLVNRLHVKLGVGIVTSHVIINDCSNCGGVTSCESMERLIDVRSPHLARPL